MIGRPEWLPKLNPTRKSSEELKMNKKISTLIVLIVAVLLPAACAAPAPVEMPEEPFVAAEAAATLTAAEAPVEPTEPAVPDGYTKFNPADFVGWMVDMGEQPSISVADFMATDSQSTMAYQGYKQALIEVMVVDGAVYTKITDDLNPRPADGFESATCDDRWQVITPEFLSGWTVDGAEAFEYVMANPAAMYTITDGNGQTAMLEVAQCPDNNVRGHLTIEDPGQ